MKYYKINEIFYSLQGEGAYTGTPVIFVRFSGCNLHCPWCDTRHEEGEELTVDQVISRIVDCLPWEGVRVPIVFTGGEPTLQLDPHLIQSLKSLGFRLHIETNGTRLIPEGIDWVTVSPKERWLVTSGDELKVVYTGQQALWSYFVVTNFRYYYLQPCSMQNTQEVIELCKRDPRWRLSLQTQKMLNIR